MVRGFTAWPRHGGEVGERPEAVVGCGCDSRGGHAVMSTFPSITHKPLAVRRVITAWPPSAVDTTPPD
jgi:hypothetical protein